MSFMNFHNSSTQNLNHQILLFMTGNAHEGSCHKLLSLILVRKKGLYIIKTDCSGEMLSQLKKKLFNGKPILPIGAAAFLFIFVVLSS